MTLVIRSLGFVVFTYVAVAILLWSMQSRLLYPAPQTPAPLTPGYAEVQLETADGLTLRAFYNPAEGDRPTVVYFHGNGGTLSGASVSNAALVEAGIGALLVEYRGYGGNPGEPAEAGFYRDGEAAMQWLAAQGIGPEETVIIGNSIGGGVAVEMARRHDPAALALVAPFTSLPDAAASNLWWLPAGWLVSDQYRNADKIAALDLPVLIQHGDADTLIPDAHGKTLVRLARDGKFQSFARSGHALSFERRSQEARRDWVLGLF
ncbi:alpha/beta hydrolase [Erythrobacter sp. JK5]|uniref:alpha/beta hydrolase n=1 Tax=Erythrobacter sp. JK5 TaxID=2829500 RepID=UPI001BA75FD5|nr:alpha/beta hydrolase [Erythrobacter sp. JK5]QUL37171.1 alpha/beta hydrolase [Erythrobacter sp. JK5]